jgi:hypothetical protein
VLTSEQGVIEGERVRATLTQLKIDNKILDVRLTCRCRGGVGRKINNTPLCARLRCTPDSHTSKNTLIPHPLLPSGVLKGPIRKQSIDFSRTPRRCAESGSLCGWTQVKTDTVVNRYAAVRSHIHDAILKLRKSIQATRLLSTFGTRLVW